MSKNNKRIQKIILIALLIITFTTGCTKTLVDKNKKTVKNNETGQNLVENILCISKVFSLKKVFPFFSPNSKHF